jgi:hypothetical protein
MGHIKLGHTLPSTILGSAQPRLPQPFSYLLKIRGVIFGAYQHAQELSCDRIGVVATRDVRPALTMLIKQNLGAIRGSKIDLESMADQRAEMRQGLSGATLHVTQMLSPQPFTLTRLHELAAWAGEPAKPPPAAETPSATPTSVVPGLAPTPAAPVSPPSASTDAASSGSSSPTVPQPPQV